jgi:hypothetical protein
MRHRRTPRPAPPNAEPLPRRAPPASGAPRARSALTWLTCAPLVLGAGLASAAEPTSPAPRPAPGADLPQPTFVDGFPVTRRDAVYPLSAVRVGQRGVGYTVFKGPNAQPFEVEILGLMKGMLGPKRDVILARLSGPEIEFSGVIAGMSGSPVYLDGKLLGAVAYRFGSFTREPIAGITPIESMLDLTRDPQLDAPLGATAASTSIDAPRVPLEPHPARLADLRSRAPIELDAWIARGGLTPALLGPRPSSASASAAAPTVAPIATPIATAGFDAEGARFLGTLLGDRAFVVGGGAGDAVAAAATSGAKTARPADVKAAPGPRPLAANVASTAGGQIAPPIRPAAPISAVLMRGDLNAAGTGTVSFVDGDLVLAFGHPFFGFGRVAFPMATAAILNTLASASGSYKQSALGAEVGAITADRISAIGGHLGARAPMVPVKITVTPVGSARAIVTEVEITSHELWLPSMVASAIQSAASGRIAEEAGGTLEIEARVQVGDRAIGFRDAYAAVAPTHLGVLAAQDVGVLCSLVLRNSLERADVRAVDVRLVTKPTTDLAVIEDATLLTPVVRPGGTARVELSLRSYRGPRRKERVDLVVPRDLDGEVELLVGGSAELDARDDEAQGDRRAESLDELLGLLTERRDGRGVYARLYPKRAGVRAGAEVMSALPPSQRLLLDESSVGRTKALTEALGPEARRATAEVVVGAATLKLQVSR